MNDKNRLQAYLALCRRIYLRHKAEGTWPWPDSQESGDMVESEDNPDNL